MKVRTLAVPPPPERKPEPPPSATARDDGRGFAKTLTAVTTPALPARKPVAPEVKAMMADARARKPDPVAARMAALPPPAVKPDTSVATALVAPPPAKPGSAPPPVKPDHTELATVEAAPPAVETAAAGDAPTTAVGREPVTERPVSVAAAPLPRAKPTPPGAQVAKDGPSRPRSPAQPDAVETEVAAAPMPDRKPSEAPPTEAMSGAARVIRASQMVAGPAGVSFNTILAQATQESGLKLHAKSRTSSAAGPFQFLERTWLDMFRRHGAAYGLGDMADGIKVRGGVPVVADKALRQKILDLRHDPDIAAGMAARLLSEGRAQMERRLKRPVSESESRLAYVFGVGGALTMIRGAERTPNTPAAELLPKAAKANHSLFHDRKTGAALSVRDALERMTRRMSIDHGRMFDVIERVASPERLDGGPSPFNPFQTASDGGNPVIGGGGTLAAPRKPV